MGSLRVVRPGVRMARVSAERGRMDRVGALYHDVRRVIERFLRLGKQPIPDSLAGRSRASSLVFAFLHLTATGKTVACRHCDQHARLPLISRWSFPFFCRESIFSRRFRASALAFSQRIVVPFFAFRSHVPDDFAFGRNGRRTCILLECYRHGEITER